MPRLARVIAPGHPHHVTQRGNRRQQTIFCEEDYAAYLGLMAHRRECSHGERARPANGQNSSGQSRMA